MIFEVRKGTEHSRNSAICHSRAADLEGEKVSDPEARETAMTQVMTAYSMVTPKVFHVTTEVSASW